MMSLALSGQSSQAYLQDTRNDNVQVYVNGEFVHRDRATVSVFDSGYVCGDGVWEGLRLVNGKLIALQAHLDRLFAGAAAIQLNIGHSPEELTDIMYNTLKINGMTDGAHLRLMITRGKKRTPNQDPRFILGGATIVCVAEYKVVDEQAKRRGLALFTSTYRTSAPDVFDLRLNSHSRLNLIQALLQALDAGADEALMLDPHGLSPAAIPPTFLSYARASCGPQTACTALTVLPAARSCHWRASRASAYRKDPLPLPKHSLRTKLLSPERWQVLPR
jgi:branched-chain amino acid aminotransferase